MAHRLEFVTPKAIRPASESRAIGASRRGFSLIELVITLVVLSILMMMVMRSTARSVSHSRVNRAAMIVAGDLELGFSLASRQRQPIVFEYNSGTGEYVLRNRNADSVFHRRSFRSDPDFLLDQVSVTQTPLTFFPTRIASNAQAVTVGMGTYTREVMMSRAGQIRVVSP